MQCNDAIVLLNDYIDGDLSVNQKTLLNLHLSSCSECREKLFQREMLIQRLNAMRVPRAPDQLPERIYRHRFELVKQAKQKLQWFVAGAGFAATLAIAVVVFNASIQMEHTNFPLAVAQTSSTDKNIHLLLHSKRGLDDVKFSIMIPESVELRGYSGRRTIAWKGKLEKGENILSLPLIKMAEQVDSVVVRIEHEKSSKEYHIQLAAKG